MRRPALTSAWILACAFCAMALFAPVRLRAQSAPSPDAPPVSTAPAEAATDEAPVDTLKVTVNLVSLYFTVKDKHNALVPHLTKEDCSVSEDKTPQTLKNFVAETDQPLTLGILLDTSASQESLLPLEQQTGGQFLKRVLRPKDEAFLISFDVDVNLLQDFTPSASQLTRAMSKAKINTAGGNGGYGGPGLGQGPIPIHGDPKGTVLYDAVYLAAHDRLQPETGRKAMILLTDGQDQGSSMKLAGAIEAAQKSNTIIYVLLLVDRRVYESQDQYGNIYSSYGGAGAMRKMAEETGGRVIDVGSNGKKLEEAFQQIEDELRTQYVASYTPTNKQLDGTYRKVEVECKGDGLKVQARKGYYALAGTE